MGNMTEPRSQADEIGGPLSCPLAMLSDDELALGKSHALRGSELVARTPRLESGIPTVAIDRVAVVGGGLMGTGIALAVLAAGRQVILIEPRADARDKALAAISQAIARDVTKGRIDESVAEARRTALTLSPEIAAAADAPLVIEAVFEDIEVKREVFAALDAIMPADAILASNTSTLDLDAIARLTCRPERVVGLHFFSPANVMRLIEVVRGARTSAETLASALAFVRDIGKIGVVSGVCDGFIGNRIFEEYLRQAYFLAEEGALPAQIDAAMERWGMAMGPFRTMDLAGQDIGWNIRRRRAEQQPDRPYSRFPDLVCEQGWFGQKTGRGIYRYPDGRTAEPDAAVEAMLLAHSASIGIERRPITDAEIVTRCVLAMINEGAKIVEEGIVYRPVDIDIVYLNGYGFPAARGGPMFQADHAGLAVVFGWLERFAAGRQGWAFAPAPLIAGLVRQGRSFADLDRG